MLHAFLGLQVQAPVTSEQVNAELAKATIPGESPMKVS